MVVTTNEEGKRRYYGYGRPWYRRVGVRPEGAVTVDEVLARQRGRRKERWKVGIKALEGREEEARRAKVVEEEVVRKAKVAEEEVVRKAKEEKEKTEKEAEEAEEEKAKEEKAKEEGAAGECIPRLRVSGAIFWG